MNKKTIAICIVLILSIFVAVIKISKMRERKQIGSSLKDSEASVQALFGEKEMKKVLKAEKNKSDAFALEMDRLEREANEEMDRWQAAEDARLKEYFEKQKKMKMKEWRQAEIEDYPMRLIGSKRYFERTKSRAEEMSVKHKEIHESIEQQKWFVDNATVNQKQLEAEKLQILKNRLDKTQKELDDAIAEQKIAERGLDQIMREGTVPYTNAKIIIAEYDIEVAVSNFSNWKSQVRSIQRDIESQIEYLIQRRREGSEEMVSDYIKQREAQRRENLEKQLAEAKIRLQEAESLKKYRADIVERLKRKVD